MSDPANDKNVALPDDVHAAIDKQYPIATKKKIVTTVMRWWLSEPPSFRRAVLGDVDADVANAYADVLEQLAKELRSHHGGRLSSSPAESVIPPEHRGKTVVLKRGAARKI